MRKLGLFPPKEKKPAYKPNPYQQMTYPGQRIQVDVKVVPRRCIADPELRLYQYTAIDEFTRLRFLAAYPEQSTYSSADFLKRLFKWYTRRGIRVECVQTDNGFEFTNRFPNSNEISLLCLSLPPPNWVSATSSFAPILLATTVKWSAVTARIRSSFTPVTAFTLWMTSPGSSLSIIDAPTTSPCGP